MSCAGREAQGQPQRALGDLGVYAESFCPGSSEPARGTPACVGEPESTAPAAGPAGRALQPEKPGLLRDVSGCRTSVSYCMATGQP